ncbi:hypothetical protein TRFO_27168 [Tritrichomonas foetus]|uniref:Uncharacterized protein n=1 Tax=Tritrichomonas foetus TaxID=1144522 RepID=A0A1J4K715_9EUKA|nr:hypothetical protein TRFO_27168 [Tritrichomonas foetus]|eukprot:OHT05221.1 hypothetical protein TRFO_27168 [Tritrichomonas foetus]
MEDSENEFSESSEKEEKPEKQKEVKKVENNNQKPQRRIIKKLSKNEIDYAKSRKQYISKLAASQSSILFSLEASPMKIGFSNRASQYKLDKFSQNIQTDQILHSESGIQIPELIDQKRFPSLIHFLKAATSTITALLDQSQFGKARSEDKQLIRLSKYTTDTVPIFVEVTSNRTFALVSDPAPLGRIVVWSATSNQPAFYLIASASPSCFSIFKDGQLVIAGTESGSLLLWDLSRVEKTKQSGSGLVLQPQCSTDSYGKRNHRFPITSLSVFGTAGTIVVATLDISSVVIFWYLKINGNDYSFVKAETVKLSAGFLPAYSMALVPNSVSSFIVGCGGKIFNCCRFGSATSPSIFHTNSVAKNLAFSPLLPNFFAASFDNGKVAIYSMNEENPVIMFTINLSLGETGVTWSPTRASVLFISDLTGMRVYIYDLMVSARTPVFMYKIGSAAQSVAVAESSSGVILAVAEGGLAVTVYNVAEKLSTPLTNEEMNTFTSILLNSK